MNCYPKVESGVVNLQLYSGWGSGDHVRMLGSTFSVVPCGSHVSKMTFETHEGLHAMIFFSRVDEPQRMGSGKTAYLDHKPKLDSCVLLMWQDGTMTIVKEDSGMKPNELAMFNPFTRSGTNVTTVDANRKIAYVVSTERISPSDPTWTYKTVSGDAMCRYIAKYSTLAELDAAAEKEIAVRNELEELRETARRTDRERAQAVNDMMNVAVAACFLAEMVRALLVHPFFSNKYGRRIAQQFGIDGTRLERVIANAGGNTIEAAKLVRAVQAELQ